MEEEGVEKSNESSNEKSNLVLSVASEAKVMKQDIEALYTSGLRVVGGRKR